ncbi:CoA ester lyase [Pseudomonas sp. ICMP22404]|uniref:HpcH/HpaI aldolase/citrate lyase family protein n=1 Tax=Pseudomonas sp. ICMP22404 TaxID=2583807 RepID=UPI001118F42B|nr:CoA ester lyase [Pseudomonas sp. ICMP22404]TNF83369.1 CoA ester lyase [Pseudomonas sp. ICMP22404]
MNNRVRRRRRCQLSVPASSLRKIEKALGSGVDHVFLDLEDAVAPSKKAEARQNAIVAFNEMDWGSTVRCFRMNGLDSHWAYEDLVTVVEAAGQNIDTLIIPKVKHARDVHFVETFLEQIELKMGFEKKIGLELLIEEVEGVANINELAMASSRVESLMFGIGDYTRAQGVDFRDAFGKPRYYPGDIWHYQRSAIAVAARMAGADFVDGPWALIPDMEGYRNECRMVKTLGGVGKWAIHPTQIPVAMEEFSPSRQEVETAVRYLTEFEAAKAQGIGAIKTAEGGLLDIAAVPLLKQVIDQARFYGIEIPGVA